MHKFLYIFCGVLLSIALNACAPYVDARREAGQIETVGQSHTPNIAICYNPVFTNKDKIKALAVTECAPKKAVYKDTKYLNCTLFYPNTAFYKCQ